LQAPIVIAGGGFGGLYTALELARRSNRPPLLLIEPRDRFLFLPFLYELLSGEMPLWQMAPHYSELLANLGIGWLRDQVEAVDPVTSSITTAAGKTIQFERLVLACGSRPNHFDIPGAASNSQGFHNLTDVEKLRHIIDELQRQRPGEERQRLAVVGAGPSGVELACTLAELLEDKADVELLERNELCLPRSKAFNRTSAISALEQGKVRLRCHCQVREVGPDWLELSTAGADATERLSVKAVIWTAGQRCQPPTGPLPQDQLGRLRCTAKLQLEGLPQIFALGDGALVPHDPALPASAQVAFQQSSLLAKNLLQSLAGKEMAPFQWRDLGEILSLGNNSASITALGFTLAGPAAMQLRRWAYLSRLPGNKLPLQVAAGWLSGPIKTCISELP
jgi:NADH dehydrogenase